MCFPWVTFFPYLESLFSEKPVLFLSLSVPPTGSKSHSVMWGSQLLLLLLWRLARASQRLGLSRMFLVCLVLRAPEGVGFQVGGLRRVPSPQATHLLLCPKAVVLVLSFQNRLLQLQLLPSPPPPPPNWAARQARPLCDARTQPVTLLSSGFQYLSFRKCAERPAILTVSQTSILPKAFHSHQNVDCYISKGPSRRGSVPLLRDDCQRSTCLA